MNAVFQRINLPMHHFGDIYRGKRVLVTGHTGFKGSWLCTWLINLGADVVGYSVDVPSEPSNFKAIGLKNKLKHIEGDVRDFDNLAKVFNETKPEIVFHFAAQAITRLSYDVPRDTFYTNFGGTLNVLECLRNSTSVEAAVMVTSDKCYQNIEWVWGYRENDRLGGNDPYSASKACAEIVCHSYFQSFLSNDRSPKVATSRAGNVIGGGDWAVDRIIPDSVRALSHGNRIVIRSPNATRPWQHVLEPLSGYLCLCSELIQKNELVAGKSFNFGPTNNVNRSVKELIEEFIKIWGDGKWDLSENGNIEKKESTLLKLNCDRALHYLRWHAALSFEETVNMTAKWYKAFYDGEEDMYGFTIQQIKAYALVAQQQRLAWAAAD